MSKRVIFKIGDVFSCQIDESHKVYFQYIYTDPLSFESHVIRIFKTKYQLDEAPDIAEIVTQEIDFYVHCDLRQGIKENLWHKVGNSTNPVDLSQIFFRTTTGGHSWHEDTKWWIWQLGDDDYTFVGKLTENQMEIDKGDLFRYQMIIHKIKTRSFENYIIGPFDSNG